LQVSLIETRRVDGKVKHEHVGSLGSIVLSPDTTDRIVFWGRVYERLSNLSNRLGPDAWGKILGEIHGRVPMVTAEEQRALQLANAKADVEQWSAIRDMSAELAAGQEQVVAGLRESIASGKKGAAEADAKAKTAEQRVAAIERGDVVEGGLGKPFSMEDFMKPTGMTRADVDHSILLATIPKEHMDEFFAEQLRLKKRSERRIEGKVARSIIRKHGAPRASSR
jgi:hypothetical protein